MMIKRFIEWMGLKERIDHADYRPPFFKEGEIWWCLIGENVGSEVNGKGEKFTRPVFILKKYDRYSFFGLPLTTKDKRGTWYYAFVYNSRRQTVQLAQGRVMSFKRLKEKMIQLDSGDSSAIKKAFADLHT